MARLSILALCLLHLLCTEAYDFTDPSYDELLEKTFSLQGPFASVTNAKLLLDTEEVTSVGRNGQPWKCSPTILRLTNVQTLNADVERPQLLISGEIHGNERVGPISTYVAAKLMVLATECLGVNKIYLSGSGAGRGAGTGTGPRSSVQEKACVELSNDYSISHPDQLNWLAMLAAKRDTFIMPTANCYGYHHNTRFDLQIDVNRDFGYMRSNDNCLTSNTAKMFNKLMLKSMLQVVVTFHGGMQAIGYEWGSPNHAGSRDAELAPDDLANRFIGGSMQVLGGSDGKKARRGFTEPYPTGPMNSLVYPVEGGMEDWMYAAGWDRNGGNVKKCAKYSNTEVPDNRALVFLVETSDAKQPQNSDLGGSDNILVHDAAAGRAEQPESAGGNGHVPRNVRAALVAIDTVQPYVCVKSVTAEGISVTMQWSVGGGAKVDATWLQWHAVGASEEDMYAHAGDDTYIRSLLPTPQPPSGEAPQRSLRGMFRGMGLSGSNRVRRARLATPPKDSVAGSTVQQGLAQWGKAAAAASIGGKAPPPSPISEAESPILHPFHAEYKAISDAPAAGSVTASIAGEEDFYWLVAWAGVDHAFGDRGQGQPAELGPQGFLANARSDPSYRKSNPAAVGLRPKAKEEAVAFPPKPEGTIKASTAEVSLAARVVQGRKYWPSEPVLVAVNRQSGSVRIAAAATSCAFWDRKSYGAVSAAVGGMVVANTPAPKNIADGGSVVGADGLPPQPKPDVNLSTGSASNAIGAIAAGGLSEQLTIAGSATAASDMPDESSIFIRMYVLLAILGSCMVVFWGAKRAFLATGGAATVAAVAAAGPKDRKDWTRNANFVKV